MAINVYSQVRKIITNWIGGMISSIDDRDASENSLRNLVGFNLSEKRGKTTRDYGASDYFASNLVPSNCTAIYGISAFRIQALSDEFIVVYGNGGGRPAFWVRKFYGPKMVLGTGQMSSSGRAVTGNADTVFTKELVVGEFISDGAQEAQRISILYGEPFDDHALSTVVAFNPALAFAPLNHLGNAFTDDWIELSGSIAGPTVQIKGMIVTDLTAYGEYSGVGDGKFRSIRILLPGQVSGSIPNNSLVGWMIRNTVTQQTAFIVGNAERFVGGFYYIDIAILENFPDWQVDDQVALFRYPDNMKLGISIDQTGSPPIGGGGPTFYSDNTSQDRLCIGWQWYAPRREVPLCVEYIKRDYFYDGYKLLVKGLIDQIYMGREIPSYASAAEVGFSFPLMLTSTSTTYPVTPDLRTTNWKNQANGTTNLYQSIDESSPSDSDYVVSTIPPNTYRDLEFKLGTTASINAKTILRLTIRMSHSFTRPAPSLSATSRQSETATLSAGWYRQGTGTITSVANSRTITGGGTSFGDQVRKGDRIVRRSTGETRTILSITSTTSLEVDAPFSAAFAGVNFDYIRTVASRPLVVDGLGAVLGVHNEVLDIDCDAVDAQEVGKGFVGGTQDLTLRLEINNFDYRIINFRPSTTVDYRVQQAQLEFKNLGTDNKKAVRLIAVPMFNGYLLGQPILYTTTADSTVAGIYPQVKVRFAEMDKRLTDIFIFTDNGVADKELDQFVSAWQFSLVATTQNVRTRPFSQVNLWSFNSVDNTFDVQLPGTTSDSPEVLAITRSDTELSELLTLVQFIGYAIVKDIPSIAANWRYQARVSSSNNAVVVIDEDDMTLRECLFDAEGQINDHVFPNRSKDASSKPLKLFLSNRGELLGVKGQIGNIYAYKRQSIEIIDGASSRSDTVSADVMGKKAIVNTRLGLTHLGKFGVYILPIHGGPIDILSDKIRDEIVNLSDSDKEAAIAVECKDLDVVIFSMPGIAYMYHMDMGIWWKRKYASTPVAMTKRYDNSVLIGANTPALGLLEYPDRSTYLDGGTAIPWVIETQWLTLGADDVQKVLRTVESVTISNGAMSYKVMVYFDRVGAPTDSLNDDGTPFDTTIVTSVSGISENPTPIRVPNSFRECKIILKHNNLQPAASDHPLDLVELKMYGEVSVTGKEN